MSPPRAVVLNGDITNYGLSKEINQYRVQYAGVNTVLPVFPGLGKRKKGTTLLGMHAEAAEDQYAARMVHCTYACKHPVNVLTAWVHRQGQGSEHVSDMEWSCSSTHRLV